MKIARLTLAQLEALLTIVKLSRTGDRRVGIETAKRRTGLTEPEINALPGILRTCQGPYMKVCGGALVALYEAGMIENLPAWAV